MQRLIEELVQWHRTFQSTSKNDNDELLIYQKEERFDVPFMVSLWKSPQTCGQSNLDGYNEFKLCLMTIHFAFIS